MPARHRPKDPAIAQSRSIAWHLALGFLVGGAAWIGLTDLIISRYGADPVVIVRLETAKSWLFVGVASALLYFATKRSVRDLARSRATIQAVVTSISDGVLLLGTDGRIVHANPAAVRLLGVDGAGELIGMDAEEFQRRFHVALPSGRMVDPKNFVSQRALKGEHLRPYKAVLHPPGKAEVVAIITGAPVRPVPDGPVALAVSVMHDVTEIEQLETMRDAFVSSAAHTLKTPVAIIKAQVDLLATGKSPSGSASAAAIDRQCGRIARLTENLLVLARLRSDSLTLEPEPIDLASLVTEATEDMKAASANHGLRARVHDRSMVFGDRDRIALVIRNLIEIAYRRSLPNTDVSLALEQAESCGRVSVSYRPLFPFEVLPEWDADAGFSGLGLERYVSAALVAASNGSLGSDVVGDDTRQDWVQIPIIEEHLHA